jgi:osmotically inducible lipoprotein OsmB
VVVKLAPSDSKRNGATRSARKAPPMTTFTRPLAIKLILTTTLLLSATACGNTWGQRAVTGGAIGAGAGAGVGAVTGIGVLPGALVGGAVGAGVGAATTPEH